ncbi:MAG: succinylglutamate desuccinylase/aspartoacylase family protein [Rhodoferax sp.]|nr:succinylglutamate desuccinylase/aspartoacylase family protein [Rhodoferax sp.]
MQTHTLELQHSTPGTRQSLQVLRFGKSGTGPKVYIQAALHADEVPAILVAHQLVQQLEQFEAQGAIRGEIVLLPFANPIGMAQTVYGQHQGRFDVRDGGNFNRGYADLASKVADKLRTVLTQDEAQNTALIRTELAQAATELVANTPAQDLKNQLLRLAVDADIVLDLHCDTDAVMHVYALTPQSALAEELSASVGARALLLATESGDSPFDEACTRTWLQLQALLPEFPIALACFGATVELRGEADTQHTLAAQDARGLCDFLARRGVIHTAVPNVPVSLCKPTPLSGSEPITAPHAGVVVFHREPGETVVAGDVIADIVDALSGQVTQLRCKSGGVLYARCGSRWATSGKRLAKIAGTSLARTGKLLSP